MQKIKAYIFSGLGADERAFQNIHFPENVEVCFIKWIRPLPDESLEKYTTRLVSGIDRTNPFTLIGLSFGGIVALEAAKKLNPSQIILISSACTFADLPWYFRIGSKMKLYNLLPVQLLQSSNFITNWFFGVTSKPGKNLLREILNDTDKTFLRWALSTIASWNTKTKPSNIFHIHGSHDRILPLRRKNTDAIVNGGSHFMVYNKAEIVGRILWERLTM